MSVTISHDFQKIFKRIRLKSFDYTRTVLKSLILEFLSKGISPVEGQRRFQRYSQSYSDAIKGKVMFRYIKAIGKVVAFEKQDPYLARYGKKVRPVNLKLTGGLYRRFKAMTKGPKVNLSFNVPYARYHQEGTSKMPARKLLPVKESEVFSRQIISRFRKGIIDITKQQFKYKSKKRL